MNKILLLFVIFSKLIFAQSVAKPNSHNIETYTDEISKLYKRLDNELKPFDDTAKYGLGILKYDTTGDKYSTGATIRIYNPLKKTIKYVWFTIAGVNPVGDLVNSNGGFYKTVKGIGPIEYQKTGEWSFDYVWLTDVVVMIKIQSIRVQYMDNTVRVIKYNPNMYVDEYRAFSALATLEEIKALEEKANGKVIDVNDTDIYDRVDQQAEFAGGMEKFRNLFNNSFDNLAVKNEGTFKTTVTFIIERDGSLSDIKASGPDSDFNRESERTIKSIHGKWNPAKINGYPVRSRFRFPVTINI
ncbi:energy transducer TonB [Elizabethkingia anophelis]|uniref:energy transducer TonB n=1 Tax=Elizabethkingia anophelis TaxID=1117645 RepID=UPI003892172F